MEGNGHQARGWVPGTLARRADGGNQAPESASRVSACSPEHRVDREGGDPRGEGRGMWIER